MYLRRFFDFEFNIAEADSQRFAMHLIDRFQLVDVFQQLAERTRDSRHLHDFDNYRRVFPQLWSALGLSLRDIDYSIRLLALLSSNVPAGMFTHPVLASCLDSNEIQEA